MPGMMRLWADSLGGLQIGPLFLNLPGFQPAFEPSAEAAARLELE